MAIVKGKEETNRKMAFNDRAIKALTVRGHATQSDYFDPDRQPPGFGVRVSRGGTRTWIYLYRYNGVKRRMKLGAVGVIGLATARDLAKDAHEVVRQGRDPQTDQKRTKHRIETVADLAERFIAEYAKNRKSSWLKDEQILKREVIPYIGRSRAVDVTRGDIRDQVLQRIVDRKAPVRANHTLQVVRKMYNWAITAKDYTSNPAALIEMPGGSRKSRDRYLAPDEIARYWRALDAPRIAKNDASGDAKNLGEQGAAAYKLLLLYAVREMELLRARWSDIDLNELIWTVPAKIAKNRHEFIVPLTTYGRSLFEILREESHPNDEFVFQSREIADTHKRRVFYEKRIIKIRSAAKLEDFTTHDLRRTATTYWGKVRLDNGQSVSREIKKRLLNHAIADVTATYDRFEYLDDKREVLEKWEAMVLQMVGADADLNCRTSETALLATADVAETLIVSGRSVSVEPDVFQTAQIKQQPPEIQSAPSRLQRET